MRKTQVLAAAAATLMGGGALIAWTDARTDEAEPASSAREQMNLSRAGDADVFAGGDESGGVAIADQAAAAPNRVVAAEPRVVKTATLQLTVSKNSLVTDATAEANHIAEVNGGFVASSESAKGADRQTALTLRVPAAAYDATLTALRRLGKVANETLGGRDVTSTLVDLDARLRSLRAQESALNALLAKANTVGETLQVAQAAAEVRTQIEQLAAQQAQLADQADFATINVSILGPHVAIDPDPGPQPLLVDALERAVGGTLAVFGGAIVLLGYALPAALLAAAGFGIWRLVDSRRRREPAVA
jgi:hypothetical protein